MAEVALDLSVIVTAHGEGRLLRPTLESVGRAIHTVRETGLTSELVVVLDFATEQTREQAMSYCDEAAITTRILISECGESGAARNYGVAQANGRYVAIVDGDDLVSSNYFLSAIRRLYQAPDLAVVHPQRVVSFGARDVYWTIHDSDSPGHGPLELVDNNLWPSSVVARRETLQAHPYEPLHPESGFGPEDWYWNITTVNSNIAHLTAPGSVFFYRVKEQSGVNNRHRHSILPAESLKQLLQSEPAPTQRAATQKPAPNSPLRILTRTVGRMLGKATRWLHPDLKRRFVHRIAPAYRAVFGITVASQRKNRLDEAMRHALRECTQDEPAISWTGTRLKDIPLWDTAPTGYASVLREVTQQLQGVQRIVLVPWVGIGGADLVSLNYANAFAQIEGGAGTTAILATYLPERTRVDLIPDNVRFVQIPARWRELTPNDQRKLLAHVLLLIQPNVVVGVNCFDLSNSLQLFSKQMTRGTRIFLTLFAWDSIGDGYPTNPITDDSERVWLDDIAGLITDNSVTAKHIQRRLGLPPESVFVHYQPAIEKTPVQPEQNSVPENFDKTHPFKLVWPHRIDREKRPDVLVEIALECKRRGLPVEIDVWGQRVLHSGGVDPIEQFKTVGIVYQGPYQGGLQNLNLSSYHALLLTSESEGLPLVLVQSQLFGIPVVASAVGGVSDIIEDRVTGMLVSPFDYAEAYADAIEDLMNSALLRKDIIRNGFAKAVKQHSPIAFTSQVAEDILGNYPKDAS